MPKKPLQPGELETEATELNAQTIGVQLAEIREKAEKEKIPLSKEMEEYTRANLRKVQDKLAKGEPVYPSDMEFIGKVKTWMEAARRNINPEQWAALMMMAGLKAERGEEIKWIDDKFQFPGNKKNKVAGDLDLRFCTGLTVLPGNLHVSGDLKLIGCTGLTALPGNLHVSGDLNISGCTGLTALPGNLHVAGGLYLRGCTGLKVLPDKMHKSGHLYLNGCAGLTALPDNLHVAGDLNLLGCTGLTALPDKLRVDGDMELRGCKGLKTLPENLKVAEDLYISKDAVKKIKYDAEKLKREGKIGGEIKYV